jgi:tRNA nucleotidyltransferase (CCA-adding enzyme)
MEKKLSTIKRPKLALIRVNPDKSKHLQTARFRLEDLGLEFDCTQLRSETYASDSRVPSTAEFGTPTQDAFRRDLTINALFYNLKTRQVEDWTGQGLPDLLQRQVLRTPQPPEQTFQGFG